MTCRHTPGGAGQGGRIGNGLIPWKTYQTALHDHVLQRQRIRRWTAICRTQLKHVPGYMADNSAQAHMVHARNALSVTQYCPYVVDCVALRAGGGRTRPGVTPLPSQPLFPRWPLAAARAGRW